LLQKFIAYINENNLLSENDAVLLSMSAGKDSVAMFYLFNEIKEQFHLKLGVFHLNHLVRGEDSDTDEAFVKSFAEKYNIPCFSHSFDFLNNRDRGKSFEEFAREKRYTLLNKIAEKEGYTKIATAHNQNDNLETFMMRLLKGTSTYGLTGISIKNKNIIRPMLSFSVEQIYSFLKKNNYKWREDLSNRSNNYERNYIRNVVFPGIDLKFKNSNFHILNVMEELGFLNSMIRKLVYDKFKDLVVKEKEIICFDFLQVADDRDLFFLIISDIFRDDFNQFINKRILNEIEKNLFPFKNNKIIYKNSQLFIQQVSKFSKNFLCFKKSDFLNNNSSNLIWSYSIDLKKELDFTLDIKEIGFSFFVKAVDFVFFEKNKKNISYVFVTITENDSQIVLRNRRKGDIISFIYGRKKIKDLFIDKKFSDEIKAQTPIVTVNDKIAAVFLGIFGQHENKIDKKFLVKKSSFKIIAIQVKKN